jgi:molybdenum cofactor cytidylyltransferase
MPTWVQRGRTEPFAAAAVLLAGGSSSRFGREPKALALIDHEPAVVRMERIARETGFFPVVAVVGAHAAALRPVLARADVQVVDNPGWELGRTGSVQAGLRSLRAGVDVLLWPVDHPFVERATLAALKDATRSDALASWIVPTFHGRGGHPVLMMSSAVREIARMPPEQPLRVIHERLGPQVVRIPVTDPGVIANVDTQEAFARELYEWRLRRPDR